MNASRGWAKWLIVAACVVSLVVVPVSAGASGSKMWDDPRVAAGQEDGIRCLTLDHLLWVPRQRTAAVSLKTLYPFDQFLHSVTCSSSPSRTVRRSAPGPAPRRP